MPAQVSHPVMSHRHALGNEGKVGTELLKQCACNARNSGVPGDDAFWLVHRGFGREQLLDGSDAFIGISLVEHLCKVRAQKSVEVGGR